MSNRVDFFQFSQTQLSLPACKISVFLEGSLCPFLEPIEMVQSDWPEFGWVRLVYNPAAYDEHQTQAEDIEAILAPGKTISLKQVYHCSEPDVGICSFVIFSGQIEGVETDIGSRGERVEIIARDLSATLKRIRVYGKQVHNKDGESLFLTGAQTLFNEDGKPNAANEPVESHGKIFTVFSHELNEGKFWSYAEVIHYLLCKYNPKVLMQTPSLKQLQALTENQIVRHLDVTSLNLLEALQKCCETIGINFRFACCDTSTDPQQAIIFYKNGCSRIVELNCPQTGESLSISKTDIAKLNSQKNFWPITHKYTGLGDFKVYEATFELVKAWNPNLEGTDYDKFSSSTNPDFHQVKDVYRKWCLNEAGDYTNAPYNQGEAFDFTNIFNNDVFVQRHRRFYPALTRNNQNKSIGYYLEESLDNGLNWQKYLYAFNNLHDECGIWLSSDMINADTWTAAQAGTLKFRITASVVSDQRLSCEITDGPLNSTAEVLEYIIKLPRQFEFRKVSSHSIFFGSNDNSLGEPDEVDDSQALFELIRKNAQANSHIIENLDVQTPYPSLYYQPGDKVISSPESRDMLGCKTDNRSIFWIKKLQTDFVKQCTNIKIIRQRNRQL